MIDNKAVGNRLLEIRKELGLTQKDVAKKIGIYHTTLHNYERGARKIPMFQIDNLCALYGVEKESLLKKEFVEV